LVERQKFTEAEGRRMQEEDEKIQRYTAEKNQREAELEEKKCQQDRLREQSQAAVCVLH
jgi:hypothetical protein